MLLRSLSVLLLAAAVGGGCATPIRPSGGPTDSTPPYLVNASPARDSTRVSTDRLALTFSERLDVASVRGALTLAPGFDAPLDVRASGARVTVLFPDSLRPQTTYVVTLGTGLKDERGVGLPRPITLAFSTGDRLDRARLAGRVLDPATGQGLSGLSVAAFPLSDTLDGHEAQLPDPRTDQALVYRTETDAEGTFQLEYLRPGPYFVTAFADRNRNRRVDDGEPVGVPALPAFVATEDSVATPVPDLFVTALDTIPPRLRRVRPLSASQHGLTFDEPLRLGAAAASAWRLTDSLGTTPFAVTAAWNTPERPQEVTLQTALLAPGAYRLVLRGTGAVADSSGNAAVVDTLFTPGTAPDTTAVRFVRFLPATRSAADSVLLLRPDQRPGVRFTAPLDSAALRRRVTLTGPDGPMAFAAHSDDGLRYTITVPDGLRTFRLDVAEPDSVHQRRFAYPTADALGAVLGQTSRPGVLVTLFPPDGAPLDTRIGADGRFAFRRLPPGEYRLRLVLDTNANGRWDGGQVAPYRPPEPIRWLPEPVRVRARWETELEQDALEIGPSGN